MAVVAMTGVMAMVAAMTGMIEQRLSKGQGNCLEF